MVQWSAPTHTRTFDLWIGSRRSQRVPSEKASGAAEMFAYKGDSTGGTACLNDEPEASSASAALAAQNSESVAQPEQNMPVQFRGHLASRDTLIHHPFPAHGSSRGHARTGGLADAMASGDCAPAFLGRRRECQALDRLLESVRAGQSRVLVLRGESGVGKSALLDYLAGNASGCRIVRAAGVESRTALAYAGLHKLSGRMLDLRERLPAPQRDALASAFSLSAGQTPDRFVVGLAVLGLLSEIARGGPLVCVVDDAQWLDDASARALAFVARRLSAQSIGLVFAVPEPFKLWEFSGFPELAVGGLHAGDAQALLESVLPGRLDERVRDRIVSESHGNPLTLLDSARGGVGPAEFAGGFALPDVMPSMNHIELTFARRL